MQWLDDLMEVNGALLAFFGVGIVGLLSQIFKSMTKIYKEKRTANEQQKKFLDKLAESDSKQSKRLSNLETYQDRLVNAQKATLHNQIWNKSEEYLNRGWITVGELDNFKHLYNAYKDLGGNSTGKTLHTKVEKLRIKDEGILKEEEIH